MNPRALLFFGTFLAFSASPLPAQDASSAPPAAVAPSGQPAKKVWTNDDVPGLRENALISTSANSSAKPPRPLSAPASARGRNAKWYHDQIAKLQAELPPLDSQIADLQAALDGKPTGNAKSSQRPRGVKSDDWSVELSGLQEKRDAVLAKITALQDEARHSGIPDSALP